MASDGFQWKQFWVQVGASLVAGMILLAVGWLVDWLWRTDAVLPAASRLELSPGDAVSFLAVAAAIFMVLRSRGRLKEREAELATAKRERDEEASNYAAERAEHAALLARSEEERGDSEREKAALQAELDRLTMELQEVLRAKGQLGAELSDLEVREARRRAALEILKQYRLSGDMGRDGPELASDLRPLVGQLWMAIPEAQRGESPAYWLQSAVLTYAHGDSPDPALMHSAIEELAAGHGLEFAIAGVRPKAILMADVGEGALDDSGIPATEMPANGEFIALCSRHRLAWLVVENTAPVPAEELFFNITIEGEANDSMGAWYDVRTGGQLAVRGGAIRLAGRAKLRLLLAVAFQEYVDTPPELVGRWFILRHDMQLEDCINHDRVMFLSRSIEQNPATITVRLLSSEPPLDYSKSLTLSIEGGVPVVREIRRPAI